MGDQQPYSIGAETWPGLSKLIEESGETAEPLAELVLLKLLGRVQQVAGKLIASGGVAQHSDGSDLKTRLEDELADLEAAAIFVATHNGLDAERMSARRRAKLELFLRWHAEGRRSHVA